MVIFVPQVKKTYISLDATFDEEFTSPLSMPDLPYQGALRIRNTELGRSNTELLNEKTGGPQGTESVFPENINMPQPKIDLLIEDTENEEVNALLCNEKLEDPTNKDSSIKAYFTSMSKFSDYSIPYSEFLYIAHELSSNNRSSDNESDDTINLSDFMPEPKSLNQILRLTPNIREKWGQAISTEITGLFDSDTFDVNERPLPADEIIPVKLALKTKLNSYGGLDKLKARICLRGDMQIKDDFNSWSPTASTRLLKCFIADAALNRTKIYQLDFIQAFIQSDVQKRIFVILDKEYEKFCPKLAKHLGRPLKLKKCLYGADFSGKSWYETLDEFLIKSLKFSRSRVEGCLYVYRNGTDWVKLINYVDDALYISNRDEVRVEFENKLKKRFNLSLLGIAKWYLGMRIRQEKDHISIDQDQYVRNITSRFEKAFKHPFKNKDSPLPTTFIPSKKDCPQNDPQIKEVKLRFGNLNYRSVIGALLYVSCCTRPDIAYAVNKLAKFSNNPGIVHFRGLLHLIGYLKNTSTKGLRFFSNYEDSSIYKLLSEHDISTTNQSVITFTDSSWNDCIDTGRSTGGNVTFNQGGAVDYGSHLPVPVAMSSGEAEYISAAVACMRASHLRMLTYDMRFLGSENYDGDNMNCEPARIIIDNEAAIAMAKCNKDTAGNRHVARRFHYVRQGTALNEHQFHWIGTKYQLADVLTKVGSNASFKPLWDILLYDIESSE